MEKYNDTIAENPKVEMIHISLDRDEGAAQNWAAKEGFPWYTVLNGDVERSGFYDYKTTRSVPEYALLSKDGKRLGSGSGVFGQVKKLAK